jgi:hypothetical protein
MSTFFNVIEVIFGLIRFVVCSGIIMLTAVCDGFTIILLRYDSRLQDLAKEMGEGAHDIVFVFCVASVFLTLISLAIMVELGIKNAQPEQE